METQDDDEERLLANVEDCVDALGVVIPPLMATHSAFVLALALTVHVNALVKIAVDTGQCTIEKAAAILSAVTKIAIDPIKLRKRDPRLS